MCVNAIRKHDPYFIVKLQHQVHLHALGNLQEGAANPALMPESVPAAHRTPLQWVTAQTNGEGLREGRAALEVMAYSKEKLDRPQRFALFG